MKGLFKKLAIIFDDLPFPEKDKVMSDRQKASTSKFKQIKKHLMRLTYIYLSGQNKYLRNTITPSDRKIIWIHDTTAHIGDSLMRTAGAWLLKDRQIDLYTNSLVAQLYNNSPIFTDIYIIGDEKHQPQDHYDLIILDAIRTKCLKNKQKLFPKTPFVTLYQYFDYMRDHYNITLFSIYRMKHLLGDSLTIKDFEKNAKQIISTTNYDEFARNIIQNKKCIAFVCGGKEAYRTYRKIPEVIRLFLQQHKDFSALLVGSENGITIKNQLISNLTGDNIIDAVAKYNLIETAAIIKHCCLLVTHDGGLLHIANAVSTPTISLFAKVLPSERYTKADHYFALHDTTDVNNIEPTVVINSISKAIIDYCNPIS